jgi:SAM-dependent methyltransferase
MSVVAEQLPRVADAERILARLDEIESYWNGRAASFSAEVRGEMNRGLLAAWEYVFSKEIAALGRPQDLAALDLGCGPGFFSILLAQMGCHVDAMDLSAGMLEQAQRNAEDAGLDGSIVFHQGDVSRTCFADNSFDLIVLRNVTWLMQDPVAAYREWHRILAPGGRLLVFDANWYRYLADRAVDEQRLHDQADPSILLRTDDMNPTLEQEASCERIAAHLPMTYLDRPSWDLSMLPLIGYASVEADEDVWQTVWPQDEKEFYRSSPMFMIKATK